MHSSTACMQSSAMRGGATCCGVQEQQNLLPRLEVFCYCQGLSATVSQGSIKSPALRVLLIAVGV
jgi:hypothetical protein